MTLKRNLLALAVASVLVGHMHSARAADTPAPDQATVAPGADSAKKGEDNTAELGEIKVTGVRAAIERAISVKQNSNEIVEAISAEDIGKLPDNSIADSLARLPGVTAQRVNGVESLISIRGFSGDFNGTLFNGREQVSTGDNRAVEFDQYPSELVSSLVVYKTPQTSLIGQGISGTVDIQTARPLDYDHRVVQLGVRGETNSYGSINPDTDSKGYRVNASYIDQYMDHTLGIAVGYARLYNPVQDERYEAYGYNFNTPDSKGNLPYPNLPVGAQYLTGLKAYGESFENTRDALITTIEWRPSEQYTSTLDLYYSKYNQDQTYRGFEACLACNGNAVLSNPVVNGNNVLVGGTWSNIKPVLRDELDAHKDNIFEIGWNNKFHFGDHWTATADLSYGKANSKQSFLEEYAGTVPGTPGSTDYFNFNLDPSTGLPHFNTGLNYGDPNIIKLTDSGGWGQDGYYKTLKVTDEIKAARFDLSRDLNSFISQVSVGLNYNERTKTRHSDEWFLDLPDGATLPNGSKNYANVPSGCGVPSVFLAYVGFPNTVSWDLNCVLNQAYVLRPNAGQGITAKDWSVQEKVTTAYVKIDLDTDIAGLPLHGNVGGQYIHTNQSSDAFADVGETATHGGISYNKFLPNLNLVLDLPDEQKLRFFAGKQMSRPRLDDESANIQPAVSTPPPSNYKGPIVTCAPTGVNCLWTGTGGNPFLKPFLANAYDLAWEKYWDNRAVVSANVWYKSLQTYIYNQNVAYDFSALPNPSNLTPSSTIGIFTRPQNGSGGYMRGYELAASVPLDILWAPLDGFGVQTSFAMTESTINPNGPGTPSSPFPGLSKYVSQITAYYEKAGFSVRMAETHRSDFLGEIQAFGADQSFVNVRGESVTDFQLGYQFESGKYEGLNFLLQVNNLFDTPYKQFYANHSQPEQYTLYGRQILLGVNYKF